MTRIIIVLTLTSVYILGRAKGEEDWATNCYPCKCAWVNGRKNADCRKSINSSFSTIPGHLSDEIRSIDFSEQPLYDLPEKAFAAKRLADLQKLKMISCQIMTVDKLAFVQMSLLIELDISKNRIKKIHPDTFKDNKRLRVVLLNDNEIERLDDGLFYNFTFLQRVELNNNKITRVGSRVFVSTGSLQYIMLENNKLSYMDMAIINNLSKLSSLSLHNNPWKCDCHLKVLRDHIVERNLVTLPPECTEPERLRGRGWSDLTSEDFACRPRIIVPPSSGAVVRADDQNVTLACKVTGDPRPDVNWVYKHAIVDTNPRRPNGQRYSVHTIDLGGNTYWFNLTIIGVGYNDAGVYKCAAKNPGGIQERNLSLEINPSFFSGGGSGTIVAISETWTLILLVVLAILILVFVITITWCCLCRRKNSARTKGDPMSPNGDVSLEGTTAEMEKSLITAVNPVVKPPRQYSVPPSVASGVTEVSEVNRTLLDNDSVFAPGDDDSCSFDFIESIPRKSSQNYLDSDRSRSERAYPPDLLSFPPRATQISPAASSASTVADHSRLPPQHGPQSPVYDQSAFYRTLPYSRSHSPFTSPLGGPTAAVRSGYVTIPRKPRASWSAASPVGGPPVAEPVYDNLGLRTTAQGSSLLSLNKTADLTPTISRTADVWSTREPDPRRLSDASLASVPEGRKVPPRPPPKPKKAVPAGPLFEDEGEDGTEV